MKILGHSSKFRGDTNLATFVFNLYSIWLHLYCELHHAHEMQTSNTLKPKKHEQQLLTNTSTYGGIEPLTLAIPG
jgi:hypothetical protein